MFSLALVLALIGKEPIGKPQPLSIKDEAALRKAIFRPLATQSPKRDFRSEVVIPEEVLSAYSKNPAEALRLLSRIADGGDVSDSLNAASYAISLVKGPRAGTVVWQTFAPGEYDAHDADWDCTPRSHWVTQIKMMVKK